MGRALKTVPKENEVKALMDGILSDLQVVTVNHAVQAVTSEEVEKLIEVVSRNKDLNIYEKRGPVMNFSNSGSGTQIAHAASGDLNFHTGTGKQINLSGPTNGTYYF